ncbi:oligosaccharide flippase family protein [Pseudodesulfovibrio sp. zrk46]|uniref:oligosaccharide flippase family protein n=1 Tax=Pseudodesulfovibrio sp. zrk46 TaxID=2725288 RepID=UPI0014499F7C|nr:oligosaccharide flippase family protein [Pseudodesulfovibrio sp. zrk46]QJB57398.1 oligosaccharide flippase family protein [Pseudodesulfovibrio sp. zrk46]
MPSVFWSYAHVLLGSAAGRALSFVNIVVCSKLLSVVDFGFYTICLAVLNVAWQISQCFDISYIKFAKVAGGEEQKSAILESNLRLKKYYIAFILAVSYPVAYCYGRYYLESSGIIVALSLSACAGAFLVYSRTLAAVYQEKERFGLYSIIGFAHPFLVFISLVGCYLFWTDMSLLSIISIYLAGAVVSMAVSVYYLRRKVAVKSGGVSGGSFREVLALSKWVLGVTLVYYVYQRVDVLLIGRIVGFEELGQYSVAAQIALVFSLFTGSVSGIFLPKSMLAVQSIQAFRKYLEEAFAPIMLILTGLICFYFLCPYVVEIGFGVSYTSSISAIKILTIGWCFQVVYLPFQYLFYALNQPRLRFLLEIMKLGTAVGLLQVLTPRYGIDGAASSISIAFFLNFIIASFVSIYSIIQHAKVVQEER